MPDLETTHEHDVPAGIEQTDDPERSDFLPPIGCDYSDDSVHSQACVHLTKVRKDSRTWMQNECIVENAVRNAKVFRYGKESAATNGEAIANDIQTTVMSISDIQTR